MNELTVSTIWRIDSMRYDSSQYCISDTIPFSAPVIRMVFVQRKEPEPTDAHQGFIYYWESTPEIRREPEPTFYQQYGQPLEVGLLALLCCLVLWWRLR